MNNTPTFQNPMWTDEEIAEQHQRIHMTSEEKRRREEETGEDPFAVLGKMVKVASKHLWRKVSQKDLLSKQKAKDETGGDPEPNHDEENGYGENTDETESPRPAPGDISPTDEPRRVLATISSNGESGQMEHHDDDHLLDVGQTETIVEGHSKYSWVKGNREELDRTG
jgi:hypothetical protein